MKFTCSCGQEHTISITVKGQKKKEIQAKETVPKDTMWALMGAYKDVKGVKRELTPQEMGRLGKACKQLYFMADKDLGVATEKIKGAKDYFKEMGCSWTIETLCKMEHYEAINKPLKSQYEGW